MHRTGRQTRRGTITQHFALCRARSVCDLVGYPLPSGEFIKAISWTFQIDQPAASCFDPYCSLDRPVWLTIRGVMGFRWICLDIHQFHCRGYRGLLQCHETCSATPFQSTQLLPGCSYSYFSLSDGMPSKISPQSIVPQFLFLRSTPYSI